MQPGDVVVVHPKVLYARSYVRARARERESERERERVCVCVYPRSK